MNDSYYSFLYIVQNKKPKLTHTFLSDKIGDLKALTTLQFKYIVGCFCLLCLTCLKETLVLIHDNPIRIKSKQTSF